ncbi:hypothetical protein C8A05DRAFT_33417, partial [Staphylotrichum tortipilum]
HHQLPQRPLFTIPGPRESAHSLAETLLKKGPRPQPHEWRPVEPAELLSSAPGLPPLTFRPWPLRAPALAAFMAVCVAMVAALIFSAVYSHRRHGLVAWAGLYGGRYFLMRVLPQLVGAGVVLYAQFLFGTVARVLPFVRLASPVREEREGALFWEMYPSFLLPRVAGPWTVWVPSLVTWLAAFTLPLLSALFTVILVGETWTWAAVQGVAWTLVALYLALIASTGVIWWFFATRESTGLVWDPRSLADIAALVAETNTADDHRGTQLARGCDGIRFALRRRAADRLCYWTWKDGRHGYWHALGSPMDEANLIPLGGAGGHRMPQHHAEKHPDPETGVSPSSSTLHRHLPLPLRTNPLLWATLTATTLLVALFVVSFHPATHLSAGFPASLPSTPRSGAFSPADFLFSFLPSLLGTVLFLAFQPLDTHLRVLQPWATLSQQQGGTAAGTLLADYAACFPGMATIAALRNRHWRVAAISLLAPLFVLIPVLAGGSFMALTTDGEDGEVRMFANTAIYGILLGLLTLYLLALVSFIPARRELGMPHAVGCLAEVVGYLVGPSSTEEDSEEAGLFRRCVSKSELEGRLLAGEGRWAFGFFEGGEEEEVGVRRMRRFTEKRKVRKSQIRRPLLK